MDIAEKIRGNFDEKRGLRAIEYEGRWHSWGDIEAFAASLGDLLDAAGVARHGRVGVVVRNRAAHAAALIGLLSQKRSISLVYSMLSGPALAAEIERLGAQAIIADEQDWPSLREACARIGSAGIAISSANMTSRLEEGLERTRIAAAADTESRIEVLSSGTTGPPKRLPLPYHILERLAGEVPPRGDEDPPGIMFWPLSGIGGFTSLVGFAVQGGSTVLLEKFAVEAFMDAIRRHRPNMVALPPAAIQMILEAGIPRDDLASLKMIFGGSAHLDPDLQERFEDAYDIPIYWAMGATEFCGTTVRWTPDLRAEFGGTKRGSVGRPVPGVELRAVDPETGETVGDGEPGLMEVLCPAVQPGWVRTTDLIAIDADGFVWHRGRNDGAIVRGGFKILPETIVDALRRHPGVVDAAVVGLPDARLGAVPAVMAARRPGHAPGEDELKAFLRDRLPTTHLPTCIVVVDELPRNGALKANLGEVRERLAAALARTAEAG